MVAVQDQGAPPLKMSVENTTWGVSYTSQRTILLRDAAAIDHKFGHGHYGITMEYLQVDH